MYKRITSFLFVCQIIISPLHFLGAQVGGDQEKAGDFDVVYGENEADDSPGKTVTKKHIIVVTGTRSKKRLKDTPVLTEVITGEEIQNSRADTLNEVLEDYGLQFMRNSMGNYIRLQGMESEKILFLIDGRRISGRIAKRLDASTIPVSNIDHIEIVRGPQSLLYGSDGMGGVINIITKKPKERSSARARIDNSFIDLNDNDNVFLMQHAQASANASFGPVYSLLYGDFSRSEYVLSEDGQTSIAPRYKKGAAGGTFGITPSDIFDITFGGDYSNSVNDNRTNRYGSYEQTYTTRAGGFVDAYYEFSDVISFKTKLYYNYYLRDKDKYSALTETWENRDRREEEDLYTGELFTAITLGKSNTLMIGVESSYNELYKYNIGPDGSGATKCRERQALVIQDEQSRKNSYAIMGGVRIEKDSSYGYFASPKISAMAYLDRSLRILGGVGVGYRAPDFSDLYLNKNDNPAHPVILGNEDLVPEKSLGVNCGFEYAGKTVYFMTNFFHNELQDEMAYELQDYQDMGRDVKVKYNLNRSLRSGFDMEGKIAFLEYFSFSAGYNFVIGYDRKNEQFLEDQPMNTLRGKLTYKNEAIGLLTYFNGRYQSEVDDLDNRDVFIVNFYMSQKFLQQVKLFISVENLTDVTDNDLGFSLGRTYSAGIEAWY